MQDSLLVEKKKVEEEGKIWSMGKAILVTSGVKTNEGDLKPKMMDRFRSSNRQTLCLSPREQHCSAHSLMLDYRSNSDFRYPKL